MSVTIASTPTPPSLWPLALDRPVGTLALGGSDLATLQRGNFLAARTVHVSALAWIAPQDAALLMQEQSPTLLIDSEGNTLAMAGDDNDFGMVRASPASFTIRYPWDLLRANEEILSRNEETRINGDVSPGAHIDGALSIGRGSRILPGVVIEGRVAIGESCTIGPNAYIRGTTSIGDGCHVGQSVEIKNSILGNNTHVAHLAYVGDSILGDGINLGAGTIVSNFRHDGNNHRSMVEGVLIDTGRSKFGTVIGDRAHTGINTSIYPGRKIGPDATTRPGQIVSLDLIRAD